jgi:hypothetical protein
MTFTDQKHDLYRKYQEQVGLYSVWSIYSVENFDAPSGITVDTLVYDEHWGPRAIEVQLRCGMKTWGDLYEAADKAIRQSGDEHHVFIEAFHVKDGRAYLTTGS